MRVLGKRCLISANSRSRPTNEVSNCGRLLRVRSTVAAARRVRHCHHRTDEPVAAPGQRLDPAVAARYPRERSADRRNLHREVGFLDHQPRPRRIEDRRLRHVLLRLADQRGQHRNRPRPQRQRRTRMGQHPSLRIQSQRTDLVEASRRIHLFRVSLRLHPACGRTSSSPTEHSKPAPQQDTGEKDMSVPMDTSASVSAPRRLESSDRPATLDHLLRLSSGDRQMRFCQVMSDEAVRAYAAKINFERDICIGVFDRQENLVALVQGFAYEEEGVRLMEAAFSTDEPMRRRGLGTLLFAEITDCALAVGVDRVIAQCLAGTGRCACSFSRQAPLAKSKTAKSSGICIRQRCFARERSIDLDRLPHGNRVRTSRPRPDAGPDAPAERASCRRDLPSRRPDVDRRFHRRSGRARRRRHVVPFQLRHACEFSLAAQDGARVGNADLVGTRRADRRTASRERRATLADPGSAAWNDCRKSCTEPLADDGGTSGAPTTFATSPFGTMNESSQRQ